MPETLDESKTSHTGSVARLRETILEELDAYPFVPPGWMRNPHAQTIGARYLRRVSLPALEFARWDTPDDDFLRVHTLKGRAENPVVLISHGLEGSVESTYVVGLLRELERVGWNAVVFEHRSCGGEMNRARRMYHSGETTDLAFMVSRIEAHWPGKPIYIAGYSLGGNQLGKWLGETGAAIPEAVRGAAVVSAPFDLVESQKFLDTGVRRIYVARFLKDLIPKAVEKDRQYPGILDVERIQQAKLFKEFDDHATAVLHGFRDAHHYYTSVACGQFLHGIRRPAMILSSADDPFNPGHTIPRDVLESNLHLVPQITEFGGHVGFVQRNGGGLGYWAEEQIVRFFAAVEARK